MITHPIETSVHYDQILQSLSPLILVPKCILDIKKSSDVLNMGNLIMSQSPSSILSKIWLYTQVVWTRQILLFVYTTLGQKSAVNAQYFKYAIIITEWLVFNLYRYGKSPIFSWQNETVIV